MKAIILAGGLGARNSKKIISALLAEPPVNVAVDCYVRTPIDKPTLLAAMQVKLGFRYKMIEDTDATDAKFRYRSLNTRAADFGYQPNLISLDGVFKR